MPATLPLRHYAIAAFAIDVSLIARLSHYFATMLPPYAACRRRHASRHFDAISLR